MSSYLARLMRHTGLEFAPGRPDGAAEAPLATGTWEPSEPAGSLDVDERRLVPPPPAAADEFDHPDTSPAPHRSEAGSQAAQRQLPERGAPAAERVDREPQLLQRSGLRSPTPGDHDAGGQDAGPQTERQHGSERSRVTGRAGSPVDDLPDVALEPAATVKASPAAVRLPRPRGHPPSPTSTAGSNASVAIPDPMTEAEAPPHRRLFGAQAVREWVAESSAAHEQPGFALEAPDITKEQAKQSASARGAPAVPVKESRPEAQGVQDLHLSIGTIHVTVEGPQPPEETEVRREETRPARERPLERSSDGTRLSRYYLRIR